MTQYSSLCDGLITSLCIMSSGFIHVGARVGISSLCKAGHPPGAQLTSSSAPWPPGVMCSEHGCTSTPSGPCLHFSRVHTQKEDCGVTQRFYFSYSEEPPDRFPQQLGQSPCPPTAHEPPISPHPRRHLSLWVFFTGGPLMGVCLLNFLKKY